MNLVKLIVAIIFPLLLINVPAAAQTAMGEGQQPQVAVDAKGAIRMVYGLRDKIYYSISKDNGITFSKPVVVSEVSEMHLGMTRGPQLASSKDYSIVSAMDKKGNIHSFRLDHKNNKWEKIKNVNDVDGSAPEGLMSIAADDKNTFYAVWLDLRHDRQNNICFSVWRPGSTWSKNEFIYRPPEGHVCECCKPSVSVKGDQVSVMFRNWVMGSRDLYLTTSENNGKSFSKAQKLGLGTWPLQGCPMDGGGISIENKNIIHTAWQRDGQVFYAQAGQPEVNVGKGRSVGLTGNLVYWQDGSDLLIKGINGNAQTVGHGTALKVSPLTDGTLIAFWESDGEIMYKKISSSK